MPRFNAHQIARPVWTYLQQHTFQGHIIGTLRHACNFMLSDGTIISIASAEHGIGPFAIMLADDTDFFEHLTVHTPMSISLDAVEYAAGSIDLTHAMVWNPTLAQTLPPGLAPLLATDVIWPTVRHGQFEPALQQAATRFERALTQDQDVTPAVVQLAGLGIGLTPTGDDYLLGAMVALWLTRHTDILATIAATATPHTTALSAAFLNAAARGHFSEPWHHLVKADTLATRLAALNVIRRTGASSGVDALAGFSRVWRAIAP